MTVHTLKTAAKLLEAYILADTPTFIWGPPGLGKSDVVRQTASKLQYNLKDIRLSLRDPVDLRGLPLVDGKTDTTRWLAPDELPQVERDGETGILFLDEANTANQATQSAAMCLVLDRKLGEYTLPKGWVPVAAGNRLADRAAANRVGTALKNRFAHIEVGVDVEAWCDWANRVQLSPMAIAFIRFRPAMLHIMPAGDENSFPTPRAWAQAAKFMDADESVRQSLVAGLVGDGPASEFEGFARVYSRLPDLEDVMRNPTRAKVPDTKEPAVSFAVASALAAYADKASFENILVYAQRLPKEFETLIALDAVKRDATLMRTKAYTTWAVRNADAVL